jgi:hypothetical protein
MTYDKQPDDEWFELEPRERSGHLNRRRPRRRPPSFETAPGKFSGHSWDEFIALAAAGLLTLDMFAAAGVTREQLEEKAQRADDPDAREGARRLLTRLVAAQRETNEGFRLAFPIQYDLFLLMSSLGGPSSESARMEACERLVHEIQWHVEDRIDPKTHLKWPVRTTLIQMARERECSVDVVKREELGAALVLAAARFHERQRIRFGSSYVHVQGDPSPAQIAPGELKWEYAWRWLKTEAIAIAEQSVCGGPRTVAYQSTSTSSAGDALDLLAAEERTSWAGGQDPLNVVLSQEKYHRMLAAFVAGSDQEQELLLLLREGLTVKAAAARMNITPKRAYDLRACFQRRIS